MIRKEKISRYTVFRVFLFGHIINSVYLKCSILGGTKVKVFISWSGLLSNSVAEILSKWLPSLINSLKVFYSPDDIEKGENWSTRLSKELSECNFGIICLTKENVLAPWINFEAGAVSKTLGSKVSAFLIDINPSDIKGPITRFQATRFEKNDFFKLVTSINNSMEYPVDTKILENSFEVIWDRIENEIRGKIQESYISLKKNYETNNRKDYEDAIQEILQIVRELSNKDIEKIEKDTIINKYFKNKGDVVQVYTDAYNKIISEITSLLRAIKEEKNGADTDKYRLIYCKSIEDLSKRLENVSYVLGNDTIISGKKMLEECRKNIILQSNKSVK